MSLARRHGECSHGKEASRVSCLQEGPGRALAVTSEMHIHSTPAFLHVAAHRTCEFNFLKFSAWARNQKALTVSETYARCRKSCTCGFVRWFRIVSPPQYLYPNAFPGMLLWGLCCCISCGLGSSHILPSQHPCHCASASDFQSFIFLRSFNCRYF